jgi:biopolymer transport protein ExbB/TolQ
MLSIILVGIFWVAIPLLFGISVVHVILKELDDAEHRKAHRKSLLDAINTSNMDKEDKAEIFCKFGNCGSE